MNKFQEIVSTSSESFQKAFGEGHSCFGGRTEPQRRPGTYLETGNDRPRHWVPLALVHNSS